MATKKVGILGSGQVGQVLASGFLKHGYEVMIASSDVSKLAEWKNKNAAGKLGSFADAARFGDTIVLAVKGTSAEGVVKSLATSLVGKVVIDATNPIAAEPPVNGVLQYFTTLTDSLMERLQKLAPQANFVKAFNCVGNVFMVNPSFPGGKPTMFICGNNVAAKKDVTQILDTFGWEAADLGKSPVAMAFSLHLKTISSEAWTSDTFGETCDFL